MNRKENLGKSFFQWSVACTNGIENPLCRSSTKRGYQRELDCKCIERLLSLQNRKLKHRRENPPTANIGYITLPRKFIQLLDWLSPGYISKSFLVSLHSMPN